ncbi:hypothetical protein [Geodermatophilus sp. SYSU D01105]
MTTATARRLSLRARLLAVFLVPLALVLAVVGVAATTALHDQMLDRVDTGLAAAVERSAHADAGGRPGGDDVGPDFLDTPGQGDGTLGARVEDGVVTEAAVITASGDGRPITAAQAAVLADVTPDACRAASTSAVRWGSTAWSRPRAPAGTCW